MYRLGDKRTSCCHGDHLHDGGHSFLICDHFLGTSPLSEIFLDYGFEKLLEFYDTMHKTSIFHLG